MDRLPRPETVRAGSLIRRFSYVKPQGRAWNELLEEATEEDKKTEVDICLEDEEDENGSESPLNLCSKSQTMPNFNVKNENVLDLSGKKPNMPDKKPTVLGPYTMPNFCYNSVEKKETTLVPSLTNSLSKTNVRKIIVEKENIPVKKTLSFSKVENTTKEIKSCKSVQQSDLGVATLTSETKVVTYSKSVTIQNTLEKEEIKVLESSPNNISSLVVKNLEPQRCQILEVTDKSVTDSNKCLNPVKNEAVEMNIKNETVEMNIKNQRDYVDGNISSAAPSHSSVHQPTPAVVAPPSMTPPVNQPQEYKAVPSQPNNHVQFAVPEVPRKREATRDLILVNGKTYRVLAIIGKGGSSKVYLVLSKDNALLAVKHVKLGNVDEKTRNDYLNEIQHLLKMQHSKHVIKLFDHQYVQSSRSLFAVMERGDTDLSKYLKDRATNGETISPELILFYWSEILLAVKSIHDNNIIHRDLKPANFLLVSGRLKLIDFGIASSIQSEQTSVFKDCLSGTCNYMSPEAIQDLGSGEETVLKIGRKTDVWSLGCILYYFLYGKTPYQEFTKLEVKLRTIANPNYKVKFPKVPGVPEILIESCKWCLVHDKNKRASVEQLLELKNQPLVSQSHVLLRLKEVLPQEYYEQAAVALQDM